MVGNQTVHGGGTTPVFTQRVYYIGTDELLEGYSLCYNFDSYDQSAEALSTHMNTGDFGVDDASPARRIQVEKPSINNCVHWAGVVSEKSAGKTGPCWVEIYKPGSVCNIWCDASVDHGSTGVGMNSGQILTFSCDSYGFEYAGVPGVGSAIVLQDVDRSTTSGIVYAELMTGMPSGGVQIVNSTHFAAEQVVSTGGALCVAPFGTTIIPSTAFTAAGLTADLTCCLVAADGEWIGQTKLFKTETAISDNALAVTLSTATYVNSSALRVTTPASLTASINGDNDGIIATWNGLFWEFKVNSSDVVVG